MGKRLTERRSEVAKGGRQAPPASTSASSRRAQPRRTARARASNGAKAITAAGSARQWPNKSRSSTAAKQPPRQTARPAQERNRQRVASDGAPTSAP